MKRAAPATEPRTSPIVGRGGRRARDSNIRVNDGHDAEDARLLDSGEHASLLTTYEPVIIGRCVAAPRESRDAENVAQDVKLGLWRELSRGKRYPTTGG